MRKKQIIVLLIIFAFINIGGISMAIFIKGENTSNDAILGKLKDYEAMDGTPLFEGKTIEGSQSFEGLALADVDADTEESWIVNVIDDYTTVNYDQEFECVLQGEHVNIWIGLNPEVLEGGYQDEYDPQGEGFEDDIWYFAYNWSWEGIDAEEAGTIDPDGDGYYLPPGYRDWITGENLLALRDAFDNNMHDCVTTHFGDYADRPGPLDDYKIQVLIFNIRDGLFHDPITAGWFIMGYFWSTISELNDANIFHMDTYQWWRRQGEPTEEHYGLNLLPLQYEGTFAHEFQHLVHYDVDGNELSWVNEGCSTFAEWKCGYGFSPGHISEYLIWHWDDSLVYWQGYLSDYGGVFLWTYYMWEHYGGDSLIWDLVHEQANGIEGWSNVLAKHGIKKTFDEIFQDWTIANYLDDTSIKKGIYGYYNLDIPSDDSEGYSIPIVLEMWRSQSNTPFFDWTVRSYPSDGLPYPNGVTLAYAANYVEFYKGGQASIELTFDGDDYTGIEAHSDEYKWSSNGDAWAWFRVHQTFDLTEVSAATLEFWTCYEIEVDWDYGYVEVYDYTTSQWSTLQGINTVDDVGQNYGTDNPNCPGDPDDWGLEPTGYYDAGLWYAFTGSSGGWYQETMDLTAFAGHEIELYFTYWTDPYTLEAGWYIDDISIPEIIFSDDCENEEHGWTTDNGWTRDNALHYNDFEVNLITIKNVYQEAGELWKSFKEINSIELTDDTELGMEDFELFDIASVQQYVVMVIANQPGYEHTFTTSYSWSAVKK